MHLTVMSFSSDRPRPTKYSMESATAGVIEEGCNREVSVDLKCSDMSCACFSMFSAAANRGIKQMMPEGCSTAFVFNPALSVYKKHRHA